MPYCQLAPSLERGTVVLRTTLELPEEGCKLRYDRTTRVLLIYRSKGDLARAIRPTVQLSRRKEFPAGTANHTITLRCYDDKLVSFKDFHSQNQDKPLLDKQGNRGCISHAKNKPEVSIINPGYRCDEFSGYKSKLNCVFIEDGFLVLPTIVPAPEGTLACEYQVEILGPEGLNIAQYFLESIIPEGNTASLRLIWRIGITTKNLKDLDLKLAVLRGSQPRTKVSKYAFLALRCKNCDAIIEEVTDAVLVPLPSEFYTKATGSNFCEECEAQVPVYTPSLIRSPKIIYEADDVISVYKTDIKVEQDRYISCTSCLVTLGNLCDSSHNFVTYRKNTIAVLCDGSFDDIFWRHSREIEAIESLQYDRKAKVIVASGQSQSIAPIPPEEKSRVQSSCIEIIKVTAAPDTFVLVGENVFQAFRILWRQNTNKEAKSSTTLSEKHFEHLLQVLLYFSEEYDPTSGYTPSLLVAI